MVQSAIQSQTGANLSYLNKIVNLNGGLNLLFSDKTDIKSRLEGLLNAKVVFNNETNQNDTLPGFRATTNIVEFVNANSDFPYDSTFVSKSDLPAEYAEQIFNLADGEVFGPYEYGNYYAVSRSMGRKAGAKARASQK